MASRKRAMRRQIQELPLPPALLTAYEAISTGFQYDTNGIANMFLMAAKLAVQARDFPNAAAWASKANTISPSPDKGQLIQAVQSEIAQPQP